MRVLDICLEMTNIHFCSKPCNFEQVLHIYYSHELLVGKAEKRNKICLILANYESTR